MAKSRDAFRTISEVADVLDTPAHVLRFWESKFKQIKPVKRAGGRRYYRPDDLAMLAVIKDLLHEKGQAIKDAQKLIRETGVKAMVAQGHDLLGSTDDHDDQAPPKPAPREVNTFDAAQSDLFSRVGLTETSAPQIADAEIAPPAGQTPDENAAAFFRGEDAAPAEVAPSAATQPDPGPALKIVLPEMPAPRDDVPSRILEVIGHADPDHLRANAPAMAPLVARLAALRDEMRHPW